MPQQYFSCLLVVDLLFMTSKVDDGFQHLLLALCQVSNTSQLLHYNNSRQVSLVAQSKPLNAGQTCQSLHSQIPSPSFRRRLFPICHRQWRFPSCPCGYIFPNQNNADRFFNSALVYELSVLKRLAQPLLLQVEPGTPERVEANRLLAFLQWFEPIPTSEQEMIPFSSKSRFRRFSWW